MLRFEDIHFAHGEAPLFEGLRAHFSRSGFHAIIGPNGSGKSTLMQIAAKILKPRHGSVHIERIDTAKMGAKGLARKLAFLPQHTTPAECSVYEAVLLGRTPHVGLKARQSDRQKALESLKRLNIAHFSDRSVMSLSGGELQKVLIARALTQGAQTILLDEPINHLDIKNQLETLQSLHDLAQKEQLSIIAILHDLALAVRYADHLICLKSGAIAYAGEASALPAETIESVFGVRCERISHRNRPHLLLF